MYIYDVYVSIYYMIYSERGLWCDTLWILLSADTDRASDARPLYSHTQTQIHTHTHTHTHINTYIYLHENIASKRDREEVRERKREIERERERVKSLARGGSLEFFYSTAFFQFFFV